MSKRWYRDQDLVLVCRQTSALTGCSGFEKTSLPVELTLPILAHTNQTLCFIFTVVSLLRLELNTLPLVLRSLAQGAAAS